MFFFLKRTDAGPVSARIENEKKKKGSATDAHAAASTAAQRVRAYPTRVRWPNQHTRASYYIYRVPFYKLHHPR